MREIRDFGERLAWGEQASDEPFWGEVYQRMFPDGVAMKNSKDNFAQRLGIDRVVLLPSGTRINVQEKKREKDYPDILLEYKHVPDSGKEWAGWIDKPAQADWLAYAFIPSRRCYFFPWPSLQKAWRELRRDWFEKAKTKEDGFSLRTSPNRGYTTHNIGIPTAALMDAVKWAQAITLDRAPTSSQPRQGRLLP